jgi:hypothetical protein
MRRSTEVTYGQFDKALRSLGLTSRMLSDDPPAIVYDHPRTAALFSIPPYPATDYVLEYHLIAARTLLDLFGYVEPKQFDAALQKAARARKRARPKKGPQPEGNRTGTGKRAKKSSAADG